MGTDLKELKPQNASISQKEWEIYTGFFDAEGNLIAAQEDSLRAYLDKMYQIYCTGESRLKCPICGNKLSKIQKWCSSCENDMFANRHIRMRRRRYLGIGDSEILCAECGKEPAKTRGLCRNCYASYLYYKKAGKSEIADAFHLQPIFSKEKKQCTVCGKRPAIAKGLCNACYRRQYRLKESEERKYAMQEMEQKREELFVRVNWEELLRQKDGE